MKWSGKFLNKNEKTSFEIINGNGFVKEYYSNVELEFEGEYINGKRNGI